MIEVPNIQDDPWNRVTTVHGFSADELVSSLQKSIRRGLVENAALVAYEMFATSPELEDHLWRRLEIISVEDVGFGRLDAPLLIHTINDFRLRASRDTADRVIFLIHAVRVLASSPKDRTSDEMATWVRQMVDSGEKLPYVPDVALDMHTRQGQEMGRGFRQWFTEGAQVANEIPDRDLTYRERILAILEAEGDMS
jgi:replication-associated recombination protein RarA